MTTQIARILILDAAPGKALEYELSNLLKHRLSVTLNINKLKDRLSPNPSFGEHFHHVDFNIENRRAFLDQIVHKGMGFDIVQSRSNISFDREVIQLAASQQLKRPLKIIAQAGVGISHIDCSAATELGIIVTHTPGSNANAVAEFVIAQVLALARNTHFHNNECHLGRWSKDAPGLTYSELKGKTLGLIGLGNVAKALMPKAHAFGMQIMGLGNKDDEVLLSIEKNGNLNELLMNSDFVSLHVPLTPNTKNLIGMRELKLMKKGAFLINTSRGGIVDEAALAEELQSPESNLSGAAIDTFEHEKSGYHTPLIGLKNVLLSPHIAGTTPEALENSTMMICKNILSILSGNLNVPIGNRMVLDRLTGFQKHSPSKIDE